MLVALLAILLSPVAGRAQIVPTDPEDPSTGVPSVSISPTSGDVTDGTMSVTITWCDANGLAGPSRSITLNGNDVTGQFSYGAGRVGCASSSGTIMLNPGNNMLAASIQDNLGNMGSGAVTYRWGDPVPVDPVTVTPATSAQTVRPNSANSVAFVVASSISGTHRWAVTPICPTGAARDCVSMADTVTIFGIQPVTVLVHFTAAQTAGATGSVQLRVARVSYTETATGTVNVTVTEPAPSDVVVDADNPGDAFSRGQCLTMSAGPGAAYECADLRLVHPLPAVRTMNKARAPVLVYNSQQAHPTPLLAARVRMIGTTVAASVEARVVVNGASYCTTSWPGAQWGSVGEIRRIVVPVNVLTCPGASGMVPFPWGPGHGVHDYTLEVAFIGTDGSRQTRMASGRLAIVDRTDSPFGAGWWLAGLEQLEPRGDGSKLWIGGDGSVRVYRPAGQANTWVAPSLAYPDTLTWNGTHYVRRLPGGDLIRFDATGRHVHTVSRLGYATTFSYVSTPQGMRLQSIAVPTPTGSLVSHSFAYSSSTGLLERVTATGNRVTTLGTDYYASSVKRVTSIQDPDFNTVRFGYGTSGAGSASRVATRVNRSGDTTYFAYDAGWRLRQVSVPPKANGTPYVHTFEPAETKGLRSAGFAFEAAQPLEAVHTKYDGPRLPAPVDVQDVTTFWVNRYGAPWRIQDAKGNQTIVTYGDSRFPALATRLQQPNGTADGRVTVAYYDARGNTMVSADLSRQENGRVAVTRFEWDQKWDAVTMMRTPTGRVSRILYDFATGNRTQEWPGDDLARRVVYSYYTAGETPQPRDFLKSITAPDTPADRVVYDGMGNVTQTWSPKGVKAYADNDGLGRTWRRRTQIDAAGTLWQEVTTTYDAMGRDSVTTTTGPAMNDVASQSLWVRTLYTADGQIRQVDRAASDAGALGMITTRWEHDALGRVVAEISPDNRIDSTRYDPAGNAVAIWSRRSGTFEGPDRYIRMEYDALNRPTKRRLPAKRYAAICRQYIPANYPAYKADENDCYPRYPTPGQGKDYLIGAEEHTFDYDVMGNLTVADNPHAQIRRVYNASGQLESETQRIQTLKWDDWTRHEYVLTYRYDLDGRLRELEHPEKLAPSPTQKVTQYRYDPLTGDLSTVIDALGNAFSFGYNKRGELDSVARPGAITEGRRYDHDGNLTWQWVRKGSAYLRNTTFTHDARGKMLSQRNAHGSLDTVRVAYSGLGHLVNDTTTTHSRPDINPDVCWTRYISNGQKQHDALGNLVRSEGSGVFVSPSGICKGSPQNTIDRFNYKADGTGRLDNSEVLSGLYSSIQRLYDDAGNIEVSTTLLNAQKSAPLQDRITYYGADNTIRAADTRSAYMFENLGKFHSSFEEYRYDALGRRVLVRNRQYCENAGLYGYLDQSRCTLDRVKRTVWDGAAELYEIQMYADSMYAIGESKRMELDVDPEPVPRYKAGEFDADPAVSIDVNPYFGRVAYTHALGTDQPISVLRMGYRDREYVNRDSAPVRELSPFALMPLWDASGQADMGVFADGALRRCVGSGQQERCVALDWPELYTGYKRTEFERKWWHGSLLEDKRDGSGLYYRRNRSYDPQSGRFTQEDPLGLAGGINLYGYAAGDPVNFSDPFGLAVCFRGKYVRDAVRATEQATGSNITLDGRNCISKIESASNNEGHSILRSRLQTMVDAGDTEFYVEIYEAAPPYFATMVYVGTDLTVLIGRQAEGVFSNRYATRKGWFCIPYSGRPSNASFVAHELLGHMYHQYRSWKRTEQIALGSEEYAWQAQNHYHRAVGEPARCGE